MVHKSKSIYAFVIGGVFELENRLLMLRDGLIIWNTDTIEFEALSNESIPLLIEANK